MTKTIAISGGHHNSALVIAKKLKQQGHQIIWFGHKHSMQSDDRVSAEYNEVVQAGITFIELKAPRLFKTNLLSYGVKLATMMPRFLKLWSGFKIDLFLGWGGYLMIPCAIAAWIKGVPIFIHEQTRITGRANQIIAHLAEKIFTSWDLEYNFPANKTIYTGLPLREEFLNLITQPHKIKPLIDNHQPTILVTAGKQGSHFINQMIDPLLASLLKQFNIIHQTGRTSLTRDYDYFKAKQAKLNQTGLTTKYLVYDYLKPQLMAQAYLQADMIISRGGAHTTYELALLGKPVIVIPAPFVPRQEQVKNADFLVNIGLGIKLNQANLTPQRLMKTINQLSHRKGEPKPHNLITKADKIILEALKPWLV